MYHPVSLPPKIYPALKAEESNHQATNRFQQLRPSQKSYTIKRLAAVGAVIATALTGAGIIAVAGVLINSAKPPLGLKHILPLWLGTSILIGGTAGVSGMVACIPDWTKYHSDEEVERLSKTISAMDLNAFIALKHKDNLYRFGIISEELKGPIDTIIYRLHAQEQILQSLAYSYGNISRKRGEFSPDFNNKTHWAFTDASDQVVANYNAAIEEKSKINADWIKLRNENIVPNLPLPEQKPVRLELIS